jgi:hypothetical protein
VYLHDYRTYEEAEANLSRFIEDVYSRKRLHPSLGYRPDVGAPAVERPETEHEFLELERLREVVVGAVPAASELDHPPVEGHRERY